MNRKPVYGPWGGGNLFVKAICKYAEDFGYEVIHGFERDIDVILMVDPRYDELGISINEISRYKSQNPNVRVIHRVNECDARKGTKDIDPLLRQCSKVTDVTIFVSNWIQDYFKKDWNTKEQHVIYNGVDHEHFRPTSKICLDNKKINLVAHHWSNNKMKGFDVYDKVDQWVKNDERFTFTYIGRDRGTFKNTRVISPKFGEELGSELGRYDIYISASRFDPGPNHIIEALACNLPTFVHRDGGGAVEFAGVDAVYESFDELVEFLEPKDFIKRFKTISNMGPDETIEYESACQCFLRWPITWEDCAEMYFEVIDGKAKAIL
jgi:glycosyltransferase involved in cell wall biosynthesis